MTKAQPSIAVARRLRVLVFEPCELLREGVERALSSWQDLLLVLEASLDRDSLARLRRPAPAVVLVGADPARPDGLEVIRRVAEVFTEIPLVVLAQDERVDSFLAAVRAGASSYILPSVSGAVLADAVRITAKGGSVIDPLVARRLVEHLASEPLLGGWRAGAVPNPSLLSFLTDREAEVLGLITQGMSNNEIASVLRISLGTVKAHVRQIFRKLRVSDRTNAALAALRTPSRTPHVSSIIVDNFLRPASAPGSMPSGGAWAEVGPDAGAVVALAGRSLPW